MEMLPLAALMLATGAVGGVLAGLLGVGGGIVIVPVLDTALGFANVDPAIRMHIAVATSLATIVPTSIASSRAHHKRGAVDFGLLKRWAAPIVVGSIIGTFIATRVDGTVLSAMFGVIALLVAIKMLLPLDDVVLANDVPRGVAAPLLPASIGMLSSMIGIGGGSLSVPSLTLCNQTIHRAVGTAALFGLLISLPGAITYIITGWGDPRLPPGSLGYVSLFGFALISPMTILTAPLGAKLAHSLSKRRLGTLFGCFLFIVSSRMIYRAILG